MGRKSLFEETLLVLISGLQRKITIYQIFIEMKIFVLFCLLFLGTVACLVSEGKQNDESDGNKIAKLLKDDDQFDNDMEDEEFDARKDALPKWGSRRRVNIHVKIGRFELRVQWYKQFEKLAAIKE